MMENDGRWEDNPRKNDGLRSLRLRMQNGEIDQPNW